MIPLSCAYRPEYRIYGYISFEVYSSLTLGNIDGHNDNPYIKPIARNWTEEYWKNYGDRLNEYWYGVIAITRDYKIVGFEMRDDGLPQNREKLNYPCIMTI